MSPAPFPTLFVSHGAPTAAITEDALAAGLRALGARLPRPRAAVVVSAHGLTPDGQVSVTAGERPRLVYDFTGFPEALYRIQYPCPGDPALAADIGRRLSAAGYAVELEADAGLDHGVWVPLLRLFPKADVPVVQVSMPYPSRPETVLAIGRALSPLRDEEVFLVGSGGAVHNLGRLAWGDPGAPPDAWATAFDTWLRERVEARRIEEILDFERRAPHARLAHPTTDHFYPIFVTLGAMREGDRVETVVDGFQMGNLSLYSFLASPA